MSELARGTKCHSGKRKNASEHDTSLTSVKHSIAALKSKNKKNRRKKKKKKKKPSQNKFDYTGKCWVAASGLPHPLYWRCS